MLRSHPLGSALARLVQHENQKVEVENLHGQLPLSAEPRYAVPLRLHGGRGGVLINPESNAS